MRLAVPWTGGLLEKASFVALEDDEKRWAIGSERKDYREVAASVPEDALKLLGEATAHPSRQNPWEGPLRGTLGHPHPGRLDEGLDQLRAWTNGDGMPVNLADDAGKPLVSLSNPPPAPMYLLNALAEYAI